MMVASKRGAFGETATNKLPVLSLSNTDKPSSSGQPVPFCAFGGCDRCELGRSSLAGLVTSIWGTKLETVCRNRDTKTGHLAIWPSPKSN